MGVLSEAKPYMPANGTEASDFEAEWCDHCTRDAAFRMDPQNNLGCDILAEATCGIQPKEWVYELGEPACTGFTSNPDWQPRCRRTPDMFTDGGRA